ncbi:piggyBac transposable element-derived protein 3-like [Eupeodes corollae]|uniref:piggyBac transposable element-derived protein 3-like n=1 Tax=Eupeodes corollae TaxID=290404 RepID=UPI0024935A25|nr:piggyBac transposable element-derived protein 3-like [Eupeodes corollae]
MAKRPFQVVSEYRRLEEAIENIFNEEDNQKVTYEKNNHEFQITVDDLKLCFGILLLTGYHSLPRERLYWSLDEDLHVPSVSKVMSKNRFVDIKKCLHFCDNDTASRSTDKLFKVRPLADLLIKKFLQWGVFHENLSIDESMIKYFERHPSKQFIRGKPVRFGYKNWIIASYDGYCFAFDIYCGKSVQSSNEPLETRVVKGLLNKVNAIPQQHIVFFDNFFTSHALLRDLRDAGYRATGTARENRTKSCSLLSIKDMKKKKQAEFDYRFDTATKILFVRWLYNSVCTMGTNYDFVHPLGKVKRWSTTEGRKTDVDIPFVFQNYNKGMGCVDQADQSVAVYRTAIRGKKWWWVLFTSMLDLAVANAWRLHLLTADEKLDQLQFRRSTARLYLRKLASGIDGRRHRKPSSVVPKIVQGHFVQKLSNQLRCIVCHKKARWQCKRCLKTLCIEKGCFEKYHT